MSPDEKMRGFENEKMVSGRYYKNATWDQYLDENDCNQ
jgi:hypothetical protein